MQLPTRIALSIILVSAIASGGTSIDAYAADLNDPIRLLEHTCDDNVHSGKADEALKQLQQAIGLARQNAKDKNRLAHLLLKHTQITVSYSPEKIWTKELLRLLDERDFINQCAINDPELLIDIDDLYDSVRLRAAQNPTLIEADCLDALNQQLHHKPKYQTEPLEVRLHYYKNRNQWHDYELLARQALKLQVEPRDKCLWLTFIRHSCLMQKNTTAADKLYKEMSAQLDKKYKHKDNGWHVVMASDLFDAGDVDEAETAVNEGIALATRQHENLSELLATRAQIYDYRKLYDKEEADLKASFAAAKIREDKIGSLQSLEQLYIKQKRKSEATQVRAELTKAKGYLKWHGD